MVQQSVTSVQNSFIGGLKTDFTGLNFPENSCTDTSNVYFDKTGDVIRRPGMDYEANWSEFNIDRSGSAVTTYRWKNAGGDGSTEYYVQQVGSLLHFYRTSDATQAQPLSTKPANNIIDMSQFITRPELSIVESEYSDGNGYLFVYNYCCDPFYCSLDGSGNITASKITIQTRDFVGLKDGLSITDRPAGLSITHKYNLQNQGWTSQPPWTTSGTNTLAIGLGLQGINVLPNVTTSIGQAVYIFLTDTSSLAYNIIPAGEAAMIGTIASYTAGYMVINVTGYNGHIQYAGGAGPYFGSGWLVQPTNLGFMTTWNSQLGNYPSNADVWWNYKDSSDVFNPLVTSVNVNLNAGYAPRGHYILSTFLQDRTSISGVSGINFVATSYRPRTGCWFAGRVWYAGTDAIQQSLTDVNSYSWTENIYFSQIVTDPSQFGMCYQVNGPTSETFLDLLPRDGGVSQIQGCGGVYKLFPISNGLLVFAANGIWFVTGSQGIGFTANDFTSTKISGIRSISSSSFVNVNGLPIFWNQEGIYQVSSTQNGGLSIDPITVGSIQTFYDGIPSTSKMSVRGDYDPINYLVKWIYRSTAVTSVDITGKYNFDSVLNYSTYTKAFFPYSFPIDFVYINGINYLPYSGSNEAPAPGFKYLVSIQIPGSYIFTFADENNYNYVDWQTAVGGEGLEYESYFVTGYQIKGQAQRQFQPSYIYMFSRGGEPTGYKIQGIWDYAISGNSGKFSSVQLIHNELPYFGMVFRKHRIRGHGLVLQIKVSSVKGMPFDIIGWSVAETVNAGI